MNLSDAASPSMSNSKGQAAEPLVVVYRATNKVNGKFYIGVTSCGVAKRRRDHFGSARTSTDKGRSKFYNAIRKYGQESFVFEVIESIASYAEAQQREIQLIALHKPHYNITAGGQGVLGYRHSPELIKRLADKKRGSVGHWRGKKRPDIAEKARERLKNKPINHWLGKSRLPEVRAKISATKTGVPRASTNELQRATFAENMRRAARARRKKVRCVNDGMEFDSATAANRFYGLKPLAVAAVASGKRNSIFGLKFEYVGASA